MSLIEIENEQARRDILKLLEQDADYEINEITLASALRELGNNISRDRLKSQLEWLKEQGLVTLSGISTTSFIKSKLTQRGADVASDTVNVSGVARMPL